MSDSRAVWKCFSKIFTRKKIRNKKHKKESPKKSEAVETTNFCDVDLKVKENNFMSNDEIIDTNGINNQPREPDQRCENESKNELSDELIDNTSKDETDFVLCDIENKAIKLKRHQTCSVDLSDRTRSPINVQELTCVNSAINFHRTSSFSQEKDFPKKMLSIKEFEEKEVLGEGAFGRAIKVEHVKTGSLFVLKEVLSHSKENEESIIREVALLRSLKHKNILTTIGLVLKDKSICLLTELMHGGSLQAKIANLEEEINVTQKLLFLRDIAAGMTFLHQHSIMHRDLTSTNCLLRKDNTVVVSDFGLSKFLNDDSDSIIYSTVDILAETFNVKTSPLLKVNDCSRVRNSHSSGDISSVMCDDNNSSLSRMSSVTKRKMTLRRKHTVVGNPFWMAPEMLASKDYNCLVDVYSFGVIGCEVTARVSALPDYLERKNKDMVVDFEAFLEKHRDGELSLCPEELIDLVRKCCDIVPDRRPTFNILLSWVEDILFRVMNNVNLKMKWSEDETQ